MRITNSMCQSAIEALNRKGISIGKPDPRDIRVEDIIKAGRTQAEFWAPILLCEWSEEEVNEFIGRARPHENAWTTFESNLFKRALSGILANRLRSVVAKPDPAVEAVLALKTTDRVYAMERQMAEKIVAVVDEARKGGTQ